MRNSRLLTRATTSRLRIAQTRSFTISSIRSRAFEEGDTVILRDKRDASHDGRLARLCSSKSTHTHRGIIKHDEIIGKEPRQLVRSSKGAAYRIHEPTLAEYVRLTPRIVTPIYPSDTNLIVSLLDVHVDTPSDSFESPPLEILEAGTGHGALTLHLSRAIHAANPHPPSSPLYATEQEAEDPVYLGESVSDLQVYNLEAWKRSRRAIVHTLDISEKHSKHAQKIVEGFRNGMYARNVDFHVGDVSSWIAHQRASRQSDDPFLSHIFLDLPNAHRYLEDVAPVLKVNGILAIFNPSITQIAECVEIIHKYKMPYILDQIIELGAGTIREWDVRAFQPRATPKEEEQELERSAASTDEPTDAAKEQKARDDELAEDLSKRDEKWVMVCRPKVGQMVVGGGFLGLWRRMEWTAPANGE